MKNKIVVYTAIFGSRDVLIAPEYAPKGVDFVCFSDRPHKAAHWEVCIVTPMVPDDLTRSNRYYKILAHEVLSEYEYSIYIDGNVFVIGDVTELISQYLEASNFAAIDCSYYSTLPSRSVAEQAERLLRPGQDKRNSESFENIRSQLAAYQAEGFPDDTGCIMGMLLLRRHNELDVIEAMNAWWNEVVTRSKRDLMSFNYVAWKYSFTFTYIPIDGADNSYVQKIRHYQSRFTRLWIRLQTLWKRCW